MVTTEKPAWIVDAAHGWLRVTRRALTASGYKPSSCSYHDRRWAYLEEDCDAPGYLDAAGQLDQAGTFETAERYDAPGTPGQWPGRETMTPFSGAGFVWPPREGVSAGEATG